MIHNRDRIFKKLDNVIIKISVSIDSTTNIVLSNTIEPFEKYSCRELL